MNLPAHLPLANWQNFYVIVGSAAGALTGLQFVVMTLIAQARAVGSMRDIRAFGTPTVVHFCSALLVSAMMVVPWESIRYFDICLFVYGVFGVIYSIGIFWHAHKASYNPDLEDWIWYTGLPLTAHLTLFASALLLLWSDIWPLYIVAADTVLFLVLGIHNSWDTVTYLAIKHGSRHTEETRSPSD